jgi:hypothetical protein
MQSLERNNYQSEKCGQKLQKNNELFTPRVYFWESYMSERAATVTLFVLS